MSARWLAWLPVAACVGGKAEGGPEKDTGGDTTIEDTDSASDSGDSCEATAWYADADGDGYGEALVTRAECDQPDGYVADASDCNDADPSMHPGVDDPCGDGVDQDCGGNADACSHGVADAGLWTTELEQGSVAAIGHFTDFSRFDALIPDGINYHPYDTSLDLYPLSRGATDESQRVGQITNADADIYNNFYFLGDALPDANGDGLDEIGLADSSESDDEPENDGTIYIWDSPHSLDRTMTDARSVWTTSDGYASLSILLPTTHAVAGLACVGMHDYSVAASVSRVLFVPPEAPSGFAQELAIAIVEDDADYRLPAAEGDINGDGMADLAYRNHGWSDEADYPCTYENYWADCDGRVAMIEGPVPEGASATSTLMGASWTGLSGDLLGYAVSLVPDASGDGLADLAVTTGGYAQSADDLYVIDGLDAGGEAATRAYAVLHQDYGVFDSQDLEVTSPGDIDSDGYGDLVVADDGWQSTFDGKDVDSGAVFILHGPFSGSIDITDAAASAIIDGKEGEYLDLAFVDDFDGDSFIDVGIHARNPPGTSVTFFFAFFGPLD